MGSARRSATGIGIAVAALVAAPLVATSISGSAGAATTPLSDAQLASLSANADHPVIVLFKNQYDQLPAAGPAAATRRGAVRATQQPVTDELHALHAPNVKAFTLLNAVSATVSAAEADRLAANPAVRAVVPDRQILAPRPDRAVGHRAAAGPSAVAPGVCPTDPKKPELAPEALTLTHSVQAQQLATGKGVRVGWIADGIDVNNPDFIRANGQHVFIDYKDFSGDGPNAPTSGAEAFGDASSIAAQGRKAYDLSTYVNAAHPLPKGCTIRVLGVAPGASLVGLKAFRTNSASTSAIVQSIDYAVTTAHVDVLNQSFGSNPYPDDNTDPVSLADDAAVAAGTTVVSSTGDAGTTNTVGSPASDPKTISAAATTSFRSYAQETGGGFQLSSGHYVSDNISALSSGGTTQRARTPDVAAPGDLGWALCTPNAKLYLGCADDNGNPSPIQNFGGTSQSSPFTAGEAALVVDAYKRTHHGARPTPALVKSIITGTADDLGHPTYEQGAGLIDSYAAVRAAMSIQDRNGTPARTGAGLLVGPTQLTKTAAPGTPADLTATVTNTGARTQLVRTSTTVQGRPVSDTRGSVRLDLTDKSAPAYVDAFGIPRTYVKVRFAVPAGHDRLDAAIAAPEGPTASPVRVILYDPKGTFTAYSIPQGNGNYAHVDVRNPRGGTWTAVIAASQGSAFTGQVRYDFATSDFHSLGRTSPATLVLGPGQSRPVTLHTTMPAPGDTNARLQLRPVGGSPSVVPVTLRSLIRSTFAGHLTGGNGRGFPGQSQTYAFDVPRGKKDVGVGVVLGGNPNLTVYGYLVDPQGQVVAAASNVLRTDSDGNRTYGRSVQLTERAPMAGRWMVDLVVLNPIAGTATSQPYAGVLRFDSVAATAHGVPNSASVRLPRGKPATATVRVTNTGLAPLHLFADGRLDRTASQRLVALAKATGVPFPDPATQWLVPTEMDSFDVTATSSQRIQTDSEYLNDLDSFTGGSERLGSIGTTSSVSQAGHPLGAGVWYSSASQVGPFTRPTPAGTADFAATVRGRDFDPAVTSSTGDVWLTAIRGASGSAAPAATATPVTLAPGKSATITVTIRPTAAKGSVVHGVLYVDTFDATLGAGSELAGVPYTYTVA